MKPTLRSLPPIQPENPISPPLSNPAVTVSPVQSPHGINPHDVNGSHAEGTGSPVRSPPPQETTKETAEHRNAPPENRRKEKSSSFWSLLREEEEPTGVRSPPLETRKVGEQLPIRALILSADHQTVPPPPSSPPPPPAHHQKESSLSSVSSIKSLSLREAMEDPAASPPVENALALTVMSILSSPANREEEKGEAAAAASNRMTASSNRMAARGTRPSAAVKGKAGGRGLRVVRKGREVARAAGWLRVSAAALSLVSVLVMAAARTSGWAGDSFERYREFRYCFSINVIVFVYSSFQVYMLVHYMCRKQHIMSHRISCYFDFSMDQILAYLLMSASSSSASRNVDWILSFGSDVFTKMINGSIAMSFLAFFALAFSSLISAYKLFSWNN